MSEVTMTWYSITDIARRAGYCVLPKAGSWVCITGCPTWPRGERLIQAHRDIGIRHLDIYWGCKETFALRSIKVSRYRRRRLDLPSAIAYDVSGGQELEKALERAVIDLQDFVQNAPRNFSSLQYSLISISHPHRPDEVRFYNSELRVFSAETIRMLLEENQLEVIPFGESQRVVLEDAIREIVDAYRIDGLSWAEAYQEVVGIGVVEPGNFIPQWFYRPRDWFRAQFCEEEDEEQCD